MKVLGYSLAVASLMALSCIAPVMHLPSVRAQQPAANNMDGRWVNVDPATRNIVRIEIKGNKIHPFGACVPDPCDWGVLKAKSFAASVDSSGTTALTATMRPTLGKKEITLTLERDGRLRAEVFTHFTDGSGRADYRSVDYLARGRAPYVP